MRSLTKVFVALLLTATICLGGFNSNANASPIHSLDHNQASSASDARSEIHPNEAVEIPVMSLPYKRVVEVANKTRCILKRVGVYNTASKWSLGDVSPLRAVGQQFSDDVFSFASNYQIDCGIGQEHRNVQFSAALTSDGTQNVNVGIITLAPYRAPYVDASPSVVLRLRMRFEPDILWLDSHRLTFDKCAVDCLFQQLMEISE